MESAKKNTKSNTGFHWKSVATEWKYFGSPLRPSREDVDQFEKIVMEKCNAINYSNEAKGAATSGEKNTFKAQLCGVTPEIAAMDWPQNSRLVAVEQSAEMINEVWPGDTEQRVALQGDWLDRDKSTYDIIIGDGCFISVDYPGGYNTFAKRLHEKLDEDGLLVMRFFTQLEEKETADDVFSDLLEGKIASFHAFKWRLAMSLQQSSQNGVRLHDIYDAWLKAKISVEDLLVGTDWNRKSIETIELYKDKQNRFSYATLAEIHDVFSGSFRICSTYIPTYELGCRCPIITFSPQ